MLIDTYKLFFSSWYIYLLFGMLFGSFLNVVIYRVPNGLSIVSPPSSCPKCGHRILWYENIPVLSWLFLKGKCSKCKLPISIEYPIIEMTVGLITLGLYLLTGPSVALLVYIPLAYTLFCIMVVDFKTYSIPHGLNITLLIISVLGVLLSINTNNFLNIGYLYSFLGGITGFGLLLLIQTAGKFIYKQDALGTGDLFLLGSAGILLGPKLILTAFILGSLLAVISYFVPSLINLKRRKTEAIHYKDLADRFGLNSLGSDANPAILGIRLQLLFNLKDPEFEKIKKKIHDLLEDQGLDNITLIRFFFRSIAVGDNDTAFEFLKKLNLASESIITEIQTVVNEDLIGYDSPKDNLNLLFENSKNINNNELCTIISQSREKILKENFNSSISDIKKEFQTIENEYDKLNYLLKYNRYFQFNGYTAEQKKIVEMIENSIDLSDNGLKQKYLSELGYVYFKDFFFEDSSKSINELLKTLEKEKPMPDSIIKLYNIALFRLVFYKQRLAFGPFLAAGIMLSLLWGNFLINSYYELLERLFL